MVKELSRISGIKKRTLDNYLREEGSIPTADTAVKIARALDVSVEYLVTGKEAKLAKKKENFLARLSPTIRMIIQSLETFSDRDRKIVYNLVKSIKDMK
jgi:transcriptional regulator with XRE-family HTH domain